MNDHPFQGPPVPQGMQGSVQGQPQIPQGLPPGLAQGLQVPGGLRTAPTGLGQPIPQPLATEYGAPMAFASGTPFSTDGLHDQGVGVTDGIKATKRKRNGGPGGSRKRRKIDPSDKRYKEVIVRFIFRNLDRPIHSTYVSKCATHKKNATSVKDIFWELHQNGFGRVEKWRDTDNSSLFFYKNEALNEKNDQKFDENLLNRLCHEYSLERSDVADGFRVPTKGSEFKKKINTGRWSKEEHEAFIRGLAEYGRTNYRLIAQNYVKTRITQQVAEYSERYFAAKRKKEKDESAQAMMQPPPPPAPNPMGLLPSQLLHLQQMQQMALLGGAQVTQQFQSQIASLQQQVGQYTTPHQQSEMLEGDGQDQMSAEQMHSHGLLVTGDAQQSQQQLVEIPGMQIPGMQAMQSMQGMQIQGMQSLQNLQSLQMPLRMGMTGRMPMQMGDDDDDVKPDMTSLEQQQQHPQQLMHPLTGQLQVGMATLSEDQMRQLQQTYSMTTAGDQSQFQTHVGPYATAQGTQYAGQVAAPAQYQPPPPAQFGGDQS